MVEGLIPGVRSRRKDRMGIVVALGRSIGGPGACEVFAALGALADLGALGVPGVQRTLRVLMVLSGRSEVRVCHFGNHA